MKHAVIEQAYAKNLPECSRSCMQAFQQANHVYIQPDPGVVPQPVVQYAPQSLPQLTSQQTTQRSPPSTPVPQPQHVFHAVQQTTNVEQV